MSRRFQVLEMTCAALAVLSDDDDCVTCNLLVNKSLKNFD